jgi:hypothetical protein
MTLKSPWLVPALVGTLWFATSSMVTTGAAPQGPASAAAPTFSADVAPIMYAKCVSCHRPGEVAPMSLITFKDVRPWASSIREKVVSRAMPPWHADRQYGTFRNEQSLTQAEIDTIVQWVNSGAAEGNPSRLPALPTFAEGWQIGTPDVVFEMPTAYEVPARGEIAYQYFEVPTNFTEDRWMQAGEVRAGDRAHVHHIIVYVKEPTPAPRPSVMTNRPVTSAAQGTATTATPRATAAGGAAAGAGAAGGGTAATGANAGTTRAAVARAAAGGNAPVSRTGDQMLVNWAVGEDAPAFLPGMGKRIPKGSSLVFQVHYTTNGTPGLDKSRIGLIFAKQTPTREIRTGMIMNPLLAIPPGAANHRVEAEATFSEDVNIWSMHPHMHLRGKDMTYTATYPDGRSEIVLRVPKFDFGWQTDYSLAKPLLLPKGSKLHVAAHFDNSTANRHNPDPTATVRWGDQTWEEMMIGFITYTVEGSVTRGTQ